MSDPQERKWYDDHREAILRGGDGTFSEEGDQEENLWKYFNASCYSGDDDGPTGFYSVYGNVFSSLRERELSSTSKSNDLPDRYPPFGDSSTPSNAVSYFYANWENFVSNLSFSWSDKYNITDAPNRQTRRLMEKENLKLREEDKKAFVSQVRSLVAFVRKRDKRMIAIELEISKRRIAEEEAKRAQKEAEIERRKLLREKRAEVNEEERQKQEAERQEERQKAFLLADNDSDEEANGKQSSWYDAASAEDAADSDQEAALQRRIQSLKLSSKEGGKKSKKEKKPSNKVESSVDAISEGDTSSVFQKIEQVGVNQQKEVAIENDAQEEEDEDEEDESDEDDSEVVFSCEICKKHFKTDPQLQQHISSKVHRKAVQELAKKSKKPGKQKG